MIENRSVLLTQVYDDAGTTSFSMLMCSRIVGGKFTIRSSNPDVNVMWEVKAVRADQPPLPVIQDVLPESHAPSQNDPAPTGKKRPSK